MRVKQLQLAAIAIAGCWSAPAFAEDRAGPLVMGTREGPPPSSGFEIAISGGYIQGFGKVGENMRTLGDISSGGGGGELALGYRLIPELMLGVYGTCGNFGETNLTPSGATLTSATAGVQAAWHFLPEATWDPWISLGTGWRGYWFTGMSSGTESRQGLQMARLQLGVDYRFTETIAVSPVLGADLSIFLTEQVAGSSAWTNIPSPNVNSFLYAALMARFDLAP